MQRLGQHFLTDQTVLALIAATIDPHAGETIIEIGPGHGELTTVLNDERPRGDGQATIIAIEKDEGLAQKLTEEFSGTARVKIVAGDALKLLPSLCAQLYDPHSTFPSFVPLRGTPTGDEALAGKSAGRHAPRSTLHVSRFKICGNIPYYITGHLLRLISELSVKPSACVFLLQREVAERITAQPPSMNRLAASVQYWAHPSIIRRVPRGAFAPPPRVDAAILKLQTDHREGSKDEDAQYHNAVRVLFQQPRKTIENNLLSGYARDERRVTPDRRSLTTLLATFGINAADRPQCLSVANIRAVAKHLDLFNASK